MTDTTIRPYRRDRIRLPAAQRRRQILDATTRLIGERGFWALSMQDVADACGLTVPGLLHHVGTKDRLLLAVLDHRDSEDFLALAQELGLDADEVWGRWSSGISLPQACEALVRRNATQPEIVRLFSVLQAESLAPDHPASGYFAERQDRTRFAEFAALAADPRASTSWRWRTRWSRSWTACRSSGCGRRRRRTCWRSGRPPPRRSSPACGSGKAGSRRLSRGRTGTRPARRTRCR